MNFAEGDVRDHRSGVILAGGATKILTLWQIIHTIADEEDPINQWKTVSAGADEFHR